MNHSLTIKRTYRIQNTVSNVWQSLVCPTLIKQYAHNCEMAEQSPEEAADSLETCATFRSGDILEYEKNVRVKFLTQTQGWPMCRRITFTLPMSCARLVMKLNSPSRLKTSWRKANALSTPSQNGRIYCLPELRACWPVSYLPKYERPQTSRTN
jgi:hypothetical protein